MGKFHKLRKLYSEAGWTEVVKRRECLNWIFLKSKLQKVV